MSFSEHIHGSVRYPVVRVRWTDAQDHSSEWTALEDVSNSLMETESVGFLVADDFKAITLVCTINENHCSGGIVIPRGCIVEMEQLRG